MTVYQCTTCGQQGVGLDQLGVVLIDPRYMQGHCRFCRTGRVFRAVDSGDAAKAAGMAAVEQSAGQGVDAAWRADAAAVARKLANQGEPFTAEDVVARVGPPAHHPNLVGALMNALRSEGLIEHAGFTKATRPESHARWIQVWRGRRAA